MPDWHKPSEKLPEDNQECVLLSHGGNLFGPIAWKDGVWLDLFATPEAGTLVRPEHVDLWTDWVAIAPPEED